MGASRRLILENKRGQKVRAFQTQAEEVSLIYRHDNRRVEIHADLKALDQKEITYDLLKTVVIEKLAQKPLSVESIGSLKLAEENEALNSPCFEMARDKTDQDLKVWIKKSSIGHAVLIACLVLLSVALAVDGQKPVEPELVTITLPPAQEKQIPNVAVAPKKITPVKRARLAVATRVVKPKNLQRIGALSAFGGTPQGAKGYQGLDERSLQNIRSAGRGLGGGGIGGNRAGGGLSSMMSGQGLIAGSYGGGGRAESAGGYGQRGVGGGKAGYGKISLVGGTSGIGLPLEDEALVEGGLDRDQIAAVINRNKGQIIYCYEQGLQKDPELRGRVSVQFIIGPAGLITRAKVARSSLSSKTVEGCMIAKMKTWQFPRPVGNVNVDVLYPFELRRVSSR